MNGWISVHDKLPDETGYYLIVYSRAICRNEMAVAFFSREDFECECDTFEDAGWEYATIGDHQKALYWMPLPDMPE